MRSLGRFPHNDALSQLLLRLSVSSFVYCRSELSAPWGFQVAAKSTPAFHLLASGSGWLEVDGSPDAVALAAGDLVILPRGDGHRVRDTRSSPVLWLDRMLEANPPYDGWLHHGGGGDRSELLCGGFAVEQVTARPLLESLPKIVHLRGSDGRSPEWLAGLIRMIAIEMASSGPGAEAVVTRLTDALLARALRQCLQGTRSTEGAPALPTALRDPQIAHALRLIREQPDRPWTVSKLASAVSLSRSAFASRFREAIGEPPMQHLTRYRLNRAADYLRTTNVGLREIARLTGYESEVSVSKAFRRAFGQPPGAFRKAALAEPEGHLKP